MTRELALGDPDLSPAFVDEWLRLERARKLIDDAEDLVPLGEVLELRTHELAGFERRAKRAAARVQSHLGGPDAVARLDAHGARVKTSWREFLLYSQSGDLKPTEGNTLTILANDDEIKGALVLDAFRVKWMWMRRPPGDFDDDGRTGWPREMRPEDIHYVQQWTERAHGLTVGSKTVGAKLGAIAARNSVDVLTDYIEGCAKAWDGKNRIDTFLTACAGVEDGEHTRAVSRRFLISAAARALEPGCKVDTMLVLEGEQGARKSTLLRVLAGGIGKTSWFSDNVPIDVDTKDACMALAGHFIVEFSELDKWKRADKAALKAFTSRQNDKFRPPYAAEPVDWPRRCVFAGTTNASAYLDDATGARRYWIVRCTAPIRIDRLRKYRDQLWGEAAHAAKASIAAQAAGLEDVRNQWWLTKDEEVRARAETDERYISDPWEAELEEWATGRAYLTTRDAMHFLHIEPAKATRADQMRLADVFIRLGYGEGVASDGLPARRRERIGTARVYRYYRTVVAQPLLLTYARAPMTQI
jgi:putative DNA primase/helicase